MTAPAPQSQPDIETAGLIERLQNWNHGCGKTMIVSETIDALARLSLKAANFADLHKNAVNKHIECDAKLGPEIATLQARVEQTEGALRAIMKACVDGRVCDDVAWFDTITTLHDFCDLVLNGPDADGPSMSLEDRK